MNEQAFDSLVVDFYRGTTGTKCDVALAGVRRACGGPGVRSAPGPSCCTRSTTPTADC